MAYTFWHCGILIGESDLDQSSGYPGQHAGIFRPTAYGLTVFPRLTGMLSASRDIKAHLDATGLSPEVMQTAEIEQLIETTPAGRKILDIGRALSEVEMRGPSGGRIEFISIAFSDLVEVQTLARELDVDSADAVCAIPTDEARYIVSATFSDEMLRSTTAKRGDCGRVRRPPKLGDN